MFCCNEIWVTHNSPKIRSISNLNINNYLIRPIWETKYCKQEGFGANKMRPLSFNLVQYFIRYYQNTVLYPIFWAKIEAQDLWNRRKTTWNSVPGVFVGVFLVHLHVLGHGKPSWWGGKKFPTSPWRLWCFVCFDIKQHPQKFDEIVKTENLLNC